MFVSVRDRPQGRRRRSQAYGVNKAARSSKLSLLSAITTQSHTSHGSNDSSSTVTQESYSKSSSGTSKRSRSSRSMGKRQGRERRHSTSKHKPSKGTEEKTMSRESVDVFAFLVHDDHADAPQLATSEVPRIRKTASLAEDSDTESVAHSLHSDSGISMGESSTHSGRDSVLVPDSRLPPLVETVHEDTDIDVSHHDDINHSPRIQWKWPDVPRATTSKHHMANHTTRASSPLNTRVVLPPTPDSSEKGFCLPASGLSGYDLVADRLASADLPPVLRSFKKVKFRLLLQLQDEILEMEQQLAALDTADSQARLNADGSSSPASRRLSWQWSQSDLPAHRLHILGRLSVKIEQYCMPSDPSHGHDRADRQ
jgi:hypothetical protein